ncbi:MAG: hypothetical protein N2322_07835, partial [Terrimicrobiaceae bacterium]|nr:hypothetical protein [Terrimicrobiaceae bacterium]
MSALKQVERPRTRLARTSADELVWRMMNRQMSEAPKAAVELHPPLAFLPLFLGKRPGMKFAEMSRLAAQNAGAWMMLAFGLLFFVLNAMHGSVELV